MSFKHIFKYLDVIYFSRFEHTDWCVDSVCLCASLWILMRSNSQIIVSVFISEDLGKEILAQYL